MKKTLIILAVIHICLGCTVLNEESNKRNIGNMSYVSNQLFSIVSSDVTVIDYCSLIEDFLGASEEERKSGKYSGLGYYPNENRFVIDGFGEIVTDGKSFTDSEMKWKATVTSSSYQKRAVTYSGEKTWEVKPDNDEEYIDIANHRLSVKDKISLCGQDVDKKNIWDCSDAGICKESGNFWVSFYTKDSLTFKRVVKTEGSTIISSLQPTGKFRLDFYENESLLDWYEAEYRDGELNKEESSIK